MKLFILAFLLLAGCASVGPTYTELAPLPPSHGMAQIVVYQPPAAIRLSSTAVDINGVPGCEIATGTFFYKDVPSGSMTISSSIWNMPGTSRLTIPTILGKRYYIKFQMDMGKSMSFGALGFVGALASEGVSSGGGPFLIESVNEEVALRDLQSLSRINCK